AIESGLVDLPFAVGLIGLSGVAIEIAHHLGDRGGVAGIDLGFIFLSAAAPHGTARAGPALEPGERRLHLGGGAELAQTGGARLADRQPQRHAVLFEGNHEDLQVVACDLLRFQSEDAADPVAGVDDIVAGRKLVIVLWHYFPPEFFWRGTLETMRLFPRARGAQGVTVLQERCGPKTPTETGSIPSEP